MTDLRNLKTCTFTARISILFGRDTPFFIFDVDNKLDNLSGKVLSEGRYLFINEKSFECLGGAVDGKGGARIQYSRMVERALANDPQLFVTGSKGVMYRAPFNLSVRTLPATLPEATLSFSPSR